MIQSAQTIFERLVLICESLVLPDVSFPKSLNQMKPSYDCALRLGTSGLHLPGVGSIEPPKTAGGGGLGKGLN